jgi:serine/threonine-protein kinase
MTEAEPSAAEAPRGVVAAGSCTVAVGDVIAGKYRVDRVLGVGGMGVVVAATHVDLLEPRAIKMLRAEYLHDAEAVARFLREARAAAHLKGEHIARVHDVGRLDNGVPFMVMEFLTGSDLGALSDARGPIPVAEAARYLLEACEALAEAHAAGIVHRDLKPENMFLADAPGGVKKIKILDFGISMVRTEDELRITNASTVMGSPFYMSPEQTQSSRDVDARTDIWALGVILYKLVTGRVPFEGSTLAQIVTSVLFGPIVPPSKLAPDVTPAMDAVVLRCLERDVDRRYPSVIELASDLAPTAPPSLRGAANRIRRVLPDTTGSFNRVDEGGANVVVRASDAPPAPRRRPFLALGVGLGLGITAGAIFLGLRVTSSSVETTTVADVAPRPASAQAAPTATPTISPTVTPVVVAAPAPTIVPGAAAPTNDAPTAPTVAPTARGKPGARSGGARTSAPVASDPVKPPPASDPFGAGRQ